MRSVYLLAAAQALSATGTIVIVLLGGILGTELAPRPEWATLPVSISILGLAGTTIPAALIMQRIGRKRAFIGSAGLAGIAALAVAYAVHRQSFPLFCIAILFMGANLAFVQQYRFAAVEYVPPQRASRAVSIVMLGTLAAAYLGPELALATRHWLTGIEFVGSFVAVAIVYGGAMALLALLPPPPAHAAYAAEPARPLGEIARQPAFVLAVLAGVCSYAVMSFIMTATPISMHVVDGLSVDETAWVIQSHLLAMYLPALASGWLVARLGIRPMMVLGILLMGHLHRDCNAGLAPGDALLVGSGAAGMRLEPAVHRRDNAAHHNLSAGGALQGTGGE